MDQNSQWNNTPFNQVRQQQQVTFTDAVKSFFTNFANFNGRARRSEFWFAILFLIMVNMTMSFLGKQTLASIISVVVLLPFLSLQCRRLHDIGRSGQWIWLMVAAYVMSMMSMVYLVLYFLIYAPEVRQQLQNINGDLSVLYEFMWLLNFKPAMFITFSFLALAISIMFIVFNCTDSQRGTNQYGPSTKYPD